MSTAVRMPARYGSAAEVAALTGLSTKTVRRRVKDGTLRGVKLGRRVLIPLDAIERAQALEPPPMSIAPTPARDRTVDPATGRLLPLSDQERAARSEALGRALDETAGMTDETDTDEVWDRFTRELDEDRLSDRPRFRS